jgi:hypothetical protein
MARRKFHPPVTNPYSVPQQWPLGDDMKHGVVKSKYLYNNYYIEFTPSWWRSAIDRALQFSDLTSLDTMYSWCLQSNPFLVSLLNKRLLPAQSRKIAVAKDGQIWSQLTDALNETKWFKEMVNGMMMSIFQGVTVMSVDPKNDETVQYPIRNVDIINRALRSMTYQYNEVVNVADYDNMFYFAPRNEESLKLGLLQQISRVMISMIKAGNDWAAANEQYAYPTVVMEYANNSDEAKKVAFEYAGGRSPGTFPVTSFTPNLRDGAQPIPDLRITPVNTQMYPESFRSYKEIMDKYEGYIMQLVLGGTLLGSTEKNTNSEQLADIHLGMYEDILESDRRMILDMFNEKTTLQKFSRLFGLDLTGCKFVYIPDTSVSLRTFKVAGEVAAKQGLRFSEETFEKIGMEAKDIIYEKPEPVMAAPAQKKKKDARPE